jgi:hypothetical protein
MRASLAGRPIRCRGCKTMFRIGQSEAVGSAKAPVVRAPPVPYSSTAAAPPVPSASAHRGKLAVHATVDDIGDVVEGPQGDECGPSVVRPRGGGARNHSGGVVTTALSVLLGGVCALPISQLILWWGFRQDPFETVKMLPPAMRWIAPAPLSQ